tara:strand:+ start:4140 stop:5060 length:921 start_codon:yes stop_codon:yes gene_type:complete
MEWLVAESVVPRLRLLDKHGYDYPDFANFHLGEFVKQNLDEVPTLTDLSKQIYLIVWLALVTYKNVADRDGEVTLAEAASSVVIKYSRELEHDVYQEDFTRFVAELAEAIGYIPLSETEEQLEQFRAYLEADEEQLSERSNIHARYGYVFDQYIADNKVVSWVPNCYVHVLLLLGPQENFKSYIENNKSVHKVCRSFTKYDLQKEDWETVLDYTEHAFGDRIDVYSEWDPMVQWREFTRSALPVADDVHRLFTIYRADWQEIWTLRGWRINLRLRSAINRFKRANPQLVFNQVGIDRITWLLKALN